MKCSPSQIATKVVIMSAKAVLDDIKPECKTIEELTALRTAYIVCGEFIDSCKNFAKEYNNTFVCCLSHCWTYRDSKRMKVVNKLKNITNILCSFTIYDYDQLCETKIKNFVPAAKLKLTTMLKTTVDVKTRKKHIRRFVDVGACDKSTNSQMSAVRELMNQQA